MTGMKVLLIVLVLIVVLFVVFVVWGAGKHSSERKTTEDDFNGQPPPHFLDAFNGVLAPFGPKLDLGQKTFDLSSTGPVVVTVPADRDHKFRTAKFHLTPTSVPGCARIEYKAPDGDGDKLNDQKWPRPPKPNKRDDDPTKVTFTILQSGGNITFTHIVSPPQPCIVQLE